MKNRNITFTTALLVLAWFGLEPVVQAVTPAPDGGYANQNTAEGTYALFSLTTGFDNTAVGHQALYSNTSGGSNTATGFEALVSNTTGAGNTATGFLALVSNTTGGGNTATGDDALYSNTTGYSNTAAGDGALYSNTTGYSNTANGVYALYFNGTGDNNTANGERALFKNTTGSGNTANGVYGLYYNRTGDNNTANGFQALFNNTGSNNIGLGFGAGYRLTTGGNNIDIGAVGVAGESNKIRIGTAGTQNATFIAGITGQTTSGGAAVFVNSSGKLGTLTSSVRFKDQIKPMDKASEAILALKPVTFRYKKEFDPDGMPQFGLVAEEVEAVDPDLVVRDKEGKPYSVRYEQVNAMLLNEFLKEHRTVQELKSTVSQQQATITQQRKDFQSSIATLEATVAHQEKAMEILATSLKNQASQIQNVKAQIELSKFATGRIRDGEPAAKKVANNP